MSSLYIVATPIGNLADITLRAIDVLRNVDLILCEDTRITKRLLDHYQIKIPTLSYHQHSQIQKIDQIINLLKQNKNLALVSDAGTPGIADPGNQLVELVVRELGDNVKIVPLPGPNAAAAAAGISGFPMDRFLFLGFPPLKNKRKKFFEEIVSSKYPVIFYESPYKILKTLKELGNADKELKIVVARELTKKFETIYRGNIEEVIKQVENGVVKGEFVVVVGKY